MINESPLNEKHDFNDISMNSMNIDCDNDMQSYKLGMISPPTNEEIIKRKI